MCLESNETVLKSLHDLYEFTMLNIMLTLNLVLKKASCFV